MGFLKKYLRKYTRSFSVAVIFLAIEAFCDLLQPTILSRIIDVGVAQRNKEYILKTGGIMLAITLVGALSASTRNIVSSHVSQNFGADLRSDLFRKIQNLSFSNIDKFNRASLMTRLTNDITQVQVFVNGLMRIFVKAPLLCIGGLIMATRLNPHLAIILAVVVPTVGVLIIINLKVGFPFFIKVQRALDRVNSVTREYLSGVRVVKAFNRFDYELERFNIVNNEYQRTSLYANRVMAGFSPTIVLTMNFGIIAVLWLGGIGVSNGQMQVGHIVAFINYMTQILFSLMLISMVFNMFVRAKASAGRVGEVFDEVEGITWENKLNGRLEGKGRIDFEDVSFSYEGEKGKLVLHNISFTCMPGETVGIIGSTGSGKSTLVGLIPRFYEASSGRIKVDGQDIAKVNPKVLRDKIAIVPQKSLLFTGTVIENIRWGKEDASFEEIQEAAKIAQAHDFICESPEVYQSRMGQGGVNFSGGQKQRLSIARALIRNPEILILDDSTSAVDVATEAKIKEGIKKYAKDLTCIIIAQRITSIIDADKIVVMNNGEIVGIGKHDELMKKCKIYQEIYLSQIGKEVQ